MEFFAHCLDPQFLEQRLLDELPLVCNSLLCYRVYHTIAVFFDLYDWTCILFLRKATGDCDGRGVSESKTNNMIQCLAQSVVRGSAGNDPGGASWGGDACEARISSCSSSSSTIGKEWAVHLVLTGDLFGVLGGVGLRSWM
jgi:hypothetical protein